MSTNPTSGGSWIRDPVTGELTPNVPAPEAPPEPAAAAEEVSFPFSGSSVMALTGALQAPEDAAAAAPTDDAAPAGRRKKG